ncbi:hypothetical protein [Mycoplasmopsis meleagridis]|uniref:hypothetical protein n=1 Tax=Mycoplasmopsis meleagridis TaxID=29561 RepID=UPI00073D4343|nr:hypothetical protein [Mycoplasmopsis meleagridis]KUH47344.1 hypothetical protein ASB56_01905 [Mycoplasmopsis meleagridis]
MVNKKIKVNRNLAALSSAAAISSAFLTLSAFYTDSNYQKKYDQRVDDAVYFVADDKYYAYKNQRDTQPTNNATWKSEYAYRYYKSDKKRNFYNNQANENVYYNKRISQKVKFATPTEGYTNRNEINPLQSWKLSNPISPQKYRVIFNDDPAMSSNEHNYYGSSPMAGGIYLSKDLRLWGEVKVNLYKRTGNGVKDYQKIQTKTYNLSTGDEKEKNSFLNEQYNIDTTNKYFDYNNGTEFQKYNHYQDYTNNGRHITLNGKSEKVFLNNVNYVTNFAVDTKKSTDQGYDITNTLIHSSYNINTPSSWDIKDRSRQFYLYKVRGHSNPNPYGLYQKPLTQYIDSFFPNQKNNVKDKNNVENKTDAFNYLYKDIGTLLSFDVNAVDYSQRYFVEVIFNVIPNTLFNLPDNKGTDYSSSGQSFIGAAMFQGAWDYNAHSVYKSYLQAGVIYHTVRKESKNLKLITREAIDQKDITNRNEVVPNLEIEVYDKSNNQVIYTIKKTDSKYNSWKNGKTSSNSYITKNVAVTTKNVADPKTKKSWNYDNLAFRVKYSNGTKDEDKKYAVSPSAKIVDISSDPNLRPYYDSSKNWKYAKIYWIYSDLYKYNEHLKTLTWLTKGQKDALIADFKNHLDLTTMLLKNGQSFNTFKSKATQINNLQKDVEQRYNSLIDSFNTNKQYDKELTWINDKDNLLFATSGSPEKLRILTDLNVYFDSLYNESEYTKKNQGTAVVKKRKTNTNWKTIDVNSLTTLKNDLDADIKNVPKMDGAKKIKEFISKIDSFALSGKTNAYNNKKAKDFVKESVKALSDDFNVPLNVFFKKYGTNTTSLTDSTNNKINKLLKDIEEKNKTYDKFKKFNNDFSKYKNTLYFSGSDSLTDDKYLQVVKYQKDFKQLENLFTNTIKSFEGKYTGSDDSKNYFANLGSLQNPLPPLEYKYDNKTSLPIKDISDFMELIIFTFDGIFGNGGLLVKKINAYRDDLLSSQEKNKFANSDYYVQGIDNQPKTTVNYFRGLRVNGHNYYTTNNSGVSTREYNNLNYDKSKNTITLNSNANKYLWEATKAIYKQAADNGKKIIDSLTNLPASLKTQYKNLIDREVEKVNKTNVDFSNVNDFNNKIPNDTSLKTHVDHAKELDSRQKELDKKAEDYAKNAENFYYPDSANTNAEKANVNNFQFKNVPSLTSVSSKSITDIHKASNGMRGSLKIKFTLKDNNTLYGYNLTSKEVTSVSLNNFAGDYEFAKKQFLSKIPYVWVGYSDKHDHFTSDSKLVDVNKVTFSFYEGGNLSNKKSLDDKNVNLKVTDIKFAKVTPEDITKWCLACIVQNCW